MPSYLEVLETNQVLPFLRTTREATLVPSYFLEVLETNQVLPFRKTCWKPDICPLSFLKSWKPLKCHRLIVLKTFCVNEVKGTYEKTQFPWVKWWWFADNTYAKTLFDQNFSSLLFHTNPGNYLASMCSVSKNLLPLKLYEICSTDYLIFLELERDLSMCILSVIHTFFQSFGYKFVCGNKVSIYLSIYNGKKGRIKYRNIMPPY